MSDISFSKYDSGALPTLTESIEHAATNPFLFSRFYDTLLIHQDGEDFVIQDPLNVLQQFSWMLDDFLVELDMPTSEYYMPEATSKALYGSHDFWYVPMLVNGCPTVADYRYKRYKVLPASQLYRIETFLRRARVSQRAFSEDKTVVFR